MTSSCRRAAAAKATNDSSLGMACCRPGGLPARHAALKAPPGAAGGQWPQGQPAPARRLLAAAANALGSDATCDDQVLAVAAVGTAATLRRQ